MQLIDCVEARHAAPILSILNDAIVNSTALYDYQPRPPSAMQPWFAAKRNGGFPVIGIENGGELLGFGSYGTFRAWPAYKYSVEHSVYVHRDHRGKGLGQLLLQALLERARQAEVHTVIGGIDAANAASAALHRKLGFECVGTIRHAGFKFGRWLDLTFYQIILDTPRQPADG
jgi:L-amino acid N-acyltransferase